MLVTVNTLPAPVPETTSPGRTSPTTIPSTASVTAPTAAAALIWNSPAARAAPAATLFEMNTPPRRHGEVVEHGHRAESPRHCEPNRRAVTGLMMALMSLRLRAYCPSRACEQLRRRQVERLRRAANGERRQRLEEAVDAVRVVPAQDLLVEAVGHRPAEIHPQRAFQPDHTEQVNPGDPVADHEPLGRRGENTDGRVLRVLRVVLRHESRRGTRRDDRVKLIADPNHARSDPGERHRRTREDPLNDPVLVGREWFPASSPMHRREAPCRPRRAALRRNAAPSPRPLRPASTAGRRTRSVGTLSGASAVLVRRSLSVIDRHARNSCTSCAYPACVSPSAAPISPPRPPASCPTRSSMSRNSRSSLVQPPPPPGCTRSAARLASACASASAVTAARCSRSADAIASDRRPIGGFLRRHVRAKLGRLGLPGRALFVGRLAGERHVRHERRPRLARRHRRGALRLGRGQGGIGQPVNRAGRLHDGLAVLAHHGLSVLAPSSASATAVSSWPFTALSYRQ